MYMKKKKILRKILFITVILLLFLFLGGSYYMGTLVVDGSTQLVTNEDTKDISESFWEKYGISYETFQNTYEIKPLAIPSSFEGHTIPGDLIYSPEASKNTVVLVHGLGGNRYTNYPVAEFFLKNGYNVITYDQRSSGENKAQKTTFGYWEKYDLMDCVSYAREKGLGDTIGIWGTSFGGATAVQAAACENTQDNLSFLILDCPVSSMEWMIEEEMRQMDTGLPLSYLMFWGNLVNRIKLGFSYGDADCTKAAENIRIPTLVINSEADEVTPYFMGKDIYDSLGGARKELWTVPDNKHTDMWLDHNREYCEKVLSLLNEKAD